MNVCNMNKKSPPTGLTKFFSAMHWSNRTQMPSEVEKCYHVPLRHMLLSFQMSASFTVNYK